MLNIKIELQSARTGKTTTIGCVNIGLDASTLRGTGARGDYHAALFKRGSKRLWKHVRVEGFPRKRLGAYDLLYRVLREAVGNRNPVSKAKVK